MQVVSISCFSLMTTLECTGFIFSHASQKLLSSSKNIIKALTENQCNQKIKILRTNRGGEFLSKELNSFCDGHGIKRELTAPYTPEQGIAERKNRTIGEMYATNQEVGIRVFG